MAAWARATPLNGALRQVAGRVLVADTGRELWRVVACRWRAQAGGLGPASQVAGMGPDRAGCRPGQRNGSVQRRRGVPRVNGSAPLSLGADPGDPQAKRPLLPLAGAAAGLEDGRDRPCAAPAGRQGVRQTVRLQPRRGALSVLGTAAMSG